MMRRRGEKNHGPPPQKASQLVDEHVSNDVVTAIEELLTSAKSGHITGLAFGAILKDRRFFVDCAGTAFADPTLARGILASLDDELQSIVHSRTERDSG